MEKITLKNGLTLELDSSDFTAHVIYSPKVNGNILIPRSINHCSREYTITSIKKGSFSNNKNIQSINFSRDSALLIIEKKSFKRSSITSIYIPSSVIELQEEWCSITKKLKNVEISPENQNFKYADETHQIIIGKSDKNKKNFDILVFANRNIDEVVIPSYIEHISSCSFQYCVYLSKIAISEDSELRSIGKNAFMCSHIESLYLPSKFETFQTGWSRITEKLREIIISPKNSNFKYIDDDHQIVAGKSDKNKEICDVIIFACKDLKDATIPSYIKRIESYSFGFCQNLQNLEIPENSELQSIGTKPFACTLINKLYIPSNLEVLEDGWCQGANHIKELIISPKNRNFKYIDEQHQIVIGKSDKNKENFDVIVFVGSNIEDVNIPSYIKRIDSYSFCNKTKIKSVTFESNSQLKSIGNSVFAFISIEKITIPKSVETIGKSSFLACPKLKEVELEKGSKLQTLSKNLFICCSLEEIKNLEESNIRSFQKNSLTSIEMKTLYIPSKLEEIEEGFLKYNETIKNIVISPKNRNFKLVNNDQILIGKSDIRQKEFDTLILACRNITEAEIPSSIKYIYSRAFEFCEDLATLTILQDSNLLSIGKLAFHGSVLESLYFPSKLEYMQEGWCQNIYYLNDIEISKENLNFQYADTKHDIIVGKSDKNKNNFDILVFASRNIKEAKIPSNITRIQQQSFGYCECLTNLEIPQNSQLVSIGNYALSDSLIERLYIPSKLEQLDDSWCESLERLNEIIISPDNMLLKYDDKNHKIILGKSDIKSNNFDAVVFACRNIKEAVIDPSIEIIQQYAFQFCKKLKKVTFTEDSNLEDIKSTAFSGSSIKSIILPKKVRNIDVAAFEECRNLMTFEYLGYIFENSVGFFDDCPNLFIVSFPNVKTITITINISYDFTLFVQAGCNTKTYFSRF